MPTNHMSPSEIPLALTNSARDSGSRLPRKKANHTFSIRSELSGNRIPKEIKTEKEFRKKKRDAQQELTRA